MSIKTGGILLGNEYAAERFPSCTELVPALCAEAFDPRGHSVHHVRPLPFRIENERAFRRNYREPFAAVAEDMRGKTASEAEVDHAQAAAVPAPKAERKGRRPIAQKLQTNSPVKDELGARGPFPHTEAGAVQHLPHGALRFNKDRPRHELYHAAPIDSGRAAFRKNAVFYDRAAERGHWRKAPCAFGPPYRENELAAYYRDNGGLFRGGAQPAATYFEH